MKSKLLLLASVLFSLTVHAQNKFYWNAVRYNDALSQSKASLAFSGDFKPATYLLFNLDESSMRNILWTAPLERTVTAQQSSAMIYVPLADGRIEKFNIAEAPVMEPKLAAKFPEIKSFVGKGIDDPSAILHCNFSPEGFFATVHSARHNTVYINCIDRQSKLYSVFERSDNDLVSQNFKCTLDPSLLNKPAADKVAPNGSADDGLLRQYRLALCVTGEFSRVFTIGVESHDDSIAQVMAAITTDLVRANAVYETDFDIRLVFVDNEDAIIFLDPNTDPFTLSNLNSKCQSTCDSKIGSANYDIGHVLAKGADNGNAGCIGCVCQNGAKGSGATTYHDPTLVDYMVIDYWTHEMGHQFGANHTFTFSQEGTNAQIEPGSGSTIMGYAGITGNTDVQPHSDDYFSCASVAQVSTYIKSATGGGKCAVNFTTGNTSPTAKGGLDYTIPISTPFVLTGRSKDADSSDVLTFDWEQIDVYTTGSNTFPRATSTTGPIFRSFLPTTDRTRYFPALSTILTGATGTKWETLSSVNRDLNFRLTVRDNHAGGGSNESDNILVKVTNTSGPFVITSPNTAVNWVAGTTQTITWNVANTTAAPVSCANVKIWLSTDGGNTFSKVLADSTPNDGSEQIIVPDKPTTQGRIKIKSIGNIFLDISDVDFTISTASRETSIADASLFKWSVQPNPAQDFIQLLFNDDLKNVSVSVSDVSGKMVYAVKQESFHADDALKINAQQLNAGIYFVRVTSDGNSYTQKVVLNK